LHLDNALGLCESLVVGAVLAGGAQARRGRVGELADHLVVQLPTGQLAQHHFRTRERVPRARQDRHPLGGRCYVPLDPQDGIGRELTAIGTDHVLAPEADAPQSG
jgi:hypothetical protein